VRERGREERPRYSGMAPGACEGSPGSNKKKMTVSTGRRSNMSRTNPVLERKKKKRKKKKYKDK
jgi:hypothetical protein